MKKKAATLPSLDYLFQFLDAYDFASEGTEDWQKDNKQLINASVLGKVFENLLASFNPETKTTARKQTGSFYTPREIVNYMVDESLIAYFKGKTEIEEEKIVNINGTEITFSVANEGTVIAKHTSRGWKLLSTYLDEFQ